jgi:hypothetical protein
MTIVMGLDQHRAQITTEWIDTETGEIGRARVAPAHREGVRRFSAGLRARSSRSRWRPRRAGGSLSRSCALWGRGCIWLSRRRRVRCAGTRSAEDRPR